MLPSFATPGGRRFRRDVVLSQYSCLFSNLLVARFTAVHTHARERVTVLYASEFISCLFRVVMLAKSIRREQGLLDGGGQVHVDGSRLRHRAREVPLPVLPIPAEPLRAGLRDAPSPCRKQSSPVQFALDASVGERVVRQSSSAPRE